MPLRFTPSSRGTAASGIAALSLALTLLGPIAAGPRAHAAESNPRMAHAGVPLPQITDAHPASGTGVRAAAASAPDLGSAPADTDASAVPRETSTVTEHELRLDGRRLAYRATAGNVLLRDDKGQPTASMFYVAYTAGAAAGAGDRKSPRPVTFLFNGGPGAASVFLLMGSFGPKRVHTESPSATPPAPYVLADNPDSLLDKTDLVFVDAVGTGFSKIVGHGTPKEFWSVDADLSAFARFIERYLTVNDRWNSPKFLIGESYGTTRAAMLAYYLGKHEISINGVVLLSSALNSAVRAPGFDLKYVRYLPSYAATAWYQGKLGLSKSADLPSFLNEVRDFAAGPYAAALAKGDDLTASERDAIATQLARYTGLDAQYIVRTRLRIEPSYFRKQLLLGQTRSVGRYDSRFEGIEDDGASSSPDFDASERYITSAFNAAFHEHLAQDLHYADDTPYRVFNGHVLASWGWEHHAWWGETLAVPYAAGDLAEAMRQNPHLKVMSANGYFDLATPFFATEYDLSHMGLEPSLRKNLRLRYYPTGHMIYLDDAALHKLKGDLSKFYDEAATR